MCGCHAMNLQNVNECYFIATLAFDAKKKTKNKKTQLENVYTFVFSIAVAGAGEMIAKETAPATTISTVERPQSYTP